MAYEQKLGRGSIFKNSRKETDKHPDYTGTYKHHDGTEFNVALWVKKGAKGSFFSMATTKKETSRQQHNDTKTTNYSDDLPF